MYPIWIFGRNINVLSSGMLYDVKIVPPSQKFVVSSVPNLVSVALFMAPLLTVVEMFSCWFLYLL